MEEAWHQWIPLKQHWATLERRTFAFPFCFLVGSKAAAQPSLSNDASPRTDLHSLTPSTRLWEKLYSVGVSPDCWWWVHVGRVPHLLSSTWLVHWQALELSRSHQRVSIYSAELWAAGVLRLLIHRLSCHLCLLLTKVKAWMLITIQVKGRVFTRLSCSDTSPKSQGQPTWLKTGYKLKRSHSLLGFSNLSGSQKSLKGLYYSWSQLNYHRHSWGTAKQKRHRERTKASCCCCCFDLVMFVCLQSIIRGSQCGNSRQKPEGRNWNRVCKEDCCLLACSLGSCSGTC